MFKRVLIILVSISIVLIPTKSNAEESIRYKSSTDQKIKHNKWTTLDFNGKTVIKGNGNRSLFCYQVALNMNGKKKPSYIKIRLAREKSGSDDTTATNYYVVDGKPSSTWVGSGCWQIKTNSPVKLQIRITGGSKTYVSDMRQFKMWTPDADYPQDFSDFIPSYTI